MNQRNSVAKRNNDQDETPIIWEIPGFKKGPRPPVPLNQPHWVYKNYGFSKPTLASIIFSFILGLLILGIVGFLFLQVWMNSQAWLARALIILLFGLGVWGFILIVMQQIFLYKSPGEDQTFEKKPARRKKLPRRRKDYQ
jgi:hypothetical protein